MATGRRLEFISRLPEGEPRPQPLLFVHGAYTGAWCWDEHFLPFFARHGYAAHALSLSGHGDSDGRDVLDTLRIADYVDDVERAIERLPAPPVLIGHSLGGFVVQHCLTRLRPAAAVLLCAVPPSGLAWSSLSMLMHHPSLLVTLNSILAGRSPDVENVREALFHQPVERARLERFVRHSQPESMRAIWDMMGFDLPDRRRMHRVPLLVLGAEHDRLIPPSEVRSAGRALGKSAEIIPGLGHAVMLERDWERVATRLLQWLESPTGRGSDT